MLRATFGRRILNVLAKFHIIYFKSLRSEKREREKKRMSRWCLVPIPHIFTNSNANFDAAKNHIQKITYENERLWHRSRVCHRIKFNLIRALVTTLFPTRGPKKNKTSDIFWALQSLNQPSEEPKSVWISKIIHTFCVYRLLWYVIKQHDLCIFLSSKFFTIILFSSSFWSLLHSYPIWRSLFSES